MSRAMPPLGWFRAFEAAARCESFTRAAEELALTQSAVSQQIRALEVRLGCRLFVRKPRGIVLTDDGRLLLPKVEASLEGLRAAVESIDGPETATRLVVATSVSIAQWYLAPRLGGFLDAHPGTSVRLVTAVWPDHLGNGRADVRIRFGPESEETGEEEPLGGRDLVLVAAPSLLDSERDLHLTARELRAYRLIHAVGTSDVWSRLAPQFGCDADHPAGIQVDSHGLAVDLARSGAGVAFTSELLARPALESGALVRAHPASVVGRDGYWVSAGGGHDADLARNFILWLRRSVSGSMSGNCRNQGGQGARPTV